MRTDLLTEEDLIAFAKQHGYPEVNHWKLERWHKEDVISRPEVERLGYARGTRSLYPAHTREQLLVACQLLRQTRNFAVIRFRLWQRGFPIPLERLKATFLQLLPILKWKIPRPEDQKYADVEQRRNTLLQKLSGRLARFILKRFGRNVLDLESFMDVSLYFLYGIPVRFEPSQDADETALVEIMERGAGLQGLRVFPVDLATDLQRFSELEVASITQLNAALDRATETDLRRGLGHVEGLVLFLEWCELMGLLPQWLRGIHTRFSEPFLQVFALLLFLRLEESGYGTLLEEVQATFRKEVPRLRVLLPALLDLRRKLPVMGKELVTPQEMLAQITSLTPPDREAYFARKAERVRELYLAHQTELDAFWHTHPEVLAMFDEEASASAPSTLPGQQS